MKRVEILLFILFFSVSLANAITKFYINNTSSYTITSIPANIVLSCDVASIGNNLACEVFVDINGNQHIDIYDERIYYLNLVDGLGWIYDGNSTLNGIPGDETGKDGFFRTTLQLDERLRPYSRQTWLVRLTDKDNSSVSVPLFWNLPASTSLAGTVRDAFSHTALPHVLVHFSDAYRPDVERFAITDSLGAFRIELTAGNWHVFTTHPVNKEYRPCAARSILFNKEKSCALDINVEKYTAFVSGDVRFENHSPVENITVALQNAATFEIFHTRTDENGHFRAGLEPGKYIVSTNQYFSRYLENHYWPEGFYAYPAVDTVIVGDGQDLSKDIVFKPYQNFIRGTCSVDGEPLRDVLVQGIAIDPLTNEQKLFQTFSAADGSYTLGVFPAQIKSIFAQKEGFITAPLSGFSNINIDEEFSRVNYNFQFNKQMGLMSVSGSVYGPAEQPLENVFVVAYNILENSPNGHLIGQTDKDGRYLFDITVEGDWQIGIFRSEAKVQPDMYYKYMSPGLKYDKLNFVVSDEKNMRTNKGQLLSSDFSIVPHFPNPFYKETVIDFVLPKSSHTQVDVLSIDGHELTTLVDHDLSSGYQKVRWDGTDNNGNLIANGVYLCRIKSQETTTVLPITLLR